MGDDKKPRGSYRKPNSYGLRDRSYRIRVNDFELKKLDDFAKRLGMAKSKAIFKAIDYYEENAYGRKEN